MGSIREKRKTVKNFKKKSKKVLFCVYYNKHGGSLMEKMKAKREI